MLLCSTSGAGFPPSTSTLIKYNASLANSSNDTIRVSSSMAEAKQIETYVVSLMDGIGYYKSSRISNREQRTGIDLSKSAVGATPVNLP